jgi:hypothetical protein
MADSDIKKDVMDEQFRGIFDKLQERFKEQMELSDGTFSKRLLNICSDHHWTVTMFVEEKRKVAVLEIRLRMMYNHLLKQYMSKSTDISASCKTEAIRMVHIDPKYVTIQRELEWRSKIKDYLELVIKIFNKRYYVLSSAQEMYKLDKSNAPLLNEIRHE